jgi:GTPase SAR1 family protein
MKALKPPPEVNILILGQTGVGKSTFINAFINYLTFQSLDHALSAEGLNWIIPCSFATSTTDEHTGQLLSRVVEIGYDPDEVSGVSGRSATQKATAYPIYIGGKLIRLIDTPGIGDTRGMEQDKQNMVHTLSVLKNYETLHGIMILLRPNDTRLDVMFRYCINELLTHLHRGAVDNIIFGFTNSRAAMYQPGNAIGPLKEQLQNYGCLLPDLYSHTVYCFDSESFRYLAARKQKEELDLGNIDDYSRSWDHSANESRRLMAYFEKRNPHSVKAILSLAETRDLIVRLVEPMGQVIKAVCNSITLNKQAMQELSTTEKTGEELRGLLNLPEIRVESEVLKDPYTVCDNSACVSHALGPNGEDVVLRKSLCKYIFRKLKFTRTITLIIRYCLSFQLPPLPIHHTLFLIKRKATIHVL